MFSFMDEEIRPVRIKVIGVGGAGCNAVNTMITSGLSRVQYVAGNTDVQALGRSQAPYKIQLGPNRTRGLGAGAKPEVGREAAMESLDGIRDALLEFDRRFRDGGLPDTVLEGDWADRLSRRARVEELADLMRSVS